MEARNYTSSSESDSGGRSKKGRKKQKSKAKKKVDVMIDRETESSDSEEETFVIKKIRQHKPSTERKKNGAKGPNDSSNVNAQAGYQQPVEPPEGSPNHHQFIPGVAYPIPDSATGNSNPNTPFESHSPVQMAYPQHILTLYSQEIDTIPRITNTKRSQPAPVAPEPVSPIPGVRYVRPGDVRAASPGPPLSQNHQNCHRHTFTDETHVQREANRNEQLETRRATEPAYTETTHIQLPPARSGSYEEYVQGHSCPPDTAPPTTRRPYDGGERDRSDDDSEVEVEVEVGRRRRKRVSFMDRESWGGRKRGERRERVRDRERRCKEGSPSPGRCDGRSRDQGGRSGEREADRREYFMSGALPERTVWRRRVVYRESDGP